MPSLENWDCVCIGNTIIYYRDSNPRHLHYREITLDYATLYIGAVAVPCICKPFKQLAYQEGLIKQAKIMCMKSIYKKMATDMCRTRRTKQYNSTKSLSKQDPKARS